VTERLAPLTNPYQMGRGRLKPIRSLGDLQNQGRREWNTISLYAHRLLRKNGCRHADAMVVMTDTLAQHQGVSHLMKAKTFPYLISQSGTMCVQS